MPHNIAVNQDIKHLADRLTETLVKQHPLYLPMAQDISACIANDGSTFHMLSRNGKWYKVPAPLDNGSPEDQKSAGVRRVFRLEKLFKNKYSADPGLFKNRKPVAASSRATTVDPVDTFTTEFEQVFEKQKFHLLNCMKESFIAITVVVAGVEKTVQVHALEKEDGVFHLLRGTNINESFHHAINHFWPKRIDNDPLADALLAAKCLSWNLKRLNGMCRLAIKGIDPSCVRISNVGTFKILDEMKLSVGPFLLLENTNYSGRISNVEINGLDKDSTRHSTAKHHGDRGSHKSSKHKKVLFSSSKKSSTPTAVADEESEEEHDETALQDAKEMTQFQLDHLLNIIQVQQINAKGQLDWNKIHSTAKLPFTKDVLKRKYNYHKLKHGPKSVPTPVISLSSSSQQPSLSQSTIDIFPTITETIVPCLPVPPPPTFIPIASVQSTLLTATSEAPRLFNAASRFSVDEINGVSLEEPPPKTPMTCDEKRLFDHLSKLNMTWKQFKTNWDYKARRYKLEHKDAILYKRSQCQLEEFAKATRKRKAITGLSSKDNPKIQRLS